jgi:TolB-like protein
MPDSPQVGTSQGAVFLSYAREDTAVAQRIAEALKSQGVEVWFDRNQLRGGDAWDQKIRRQIGECALFLAIISQHTQERVKGYFRLEWKLAVEQTHLLAEGIVFLAPVVVDDTPEGGAVVPPEFMRVQWARLPGGLPTARFVDDVKRLLGSPRMPLSTSPNSSHSPEPRPNAKSIAVLAFANLSRDPENEYFSDGISEELLNLLAKIPGLGVAARTSAFFFKGKNVPIPEIARTLGVAHVVEGSVRKSGNRVRITAQLINAADGFHMWSETFDRELQDIFAVQDEIAGLIAQNLQLRLGQELRSSKQVDPEAYRLVLEGRHFWSLRTATGYARAENAFLRSLEISPDFAQAHAGLADVYALRAIFASFADGTLHTEEMMRAKAQADRALSLDPSLAEVHGALALNAFYTHSFKDADRHFGRMFQLNPNYAIGHLWYAHLLSARGRIDLGLSEVERAIALDPLSFPALAFRGMLLNFAKRHEDALEINARAAALVGGNFPGFDGTRCVALLSLGRREEALEAARSLLRDKSEAASRGPKDEAIYALCQAGAADEASEEADKIRETLPPESYNRGTLLQALGRFSEALPYLAEPPAVHLVKLYFHPMWDAVRNEPRFHQILANIGCEAEYKVGRETLARMLEGPGRQ